jgi:hypothetical protein
MTAANELLQAAHTRLSGDASLAELIGPDGIHDRLLSRPAMPCLVISELRTDDFSTATETSEEHLLVIEAWSAEQGQRQVQAIADRVRQLLHDAALPLAGVALVSLLFRSVRVRREPKSRCHVAEMRFRAVTE